MKKFIKVTAVIGSAALLLSGCGTAGQKDVEGKPVLRALINNIKVDPNTYPVAKMLEEKTGYKVEYDLLPQDNAQEKLSIVLASGEEYDYITVLAAQYNLFVDYAQQGALKDLDSLIEKYGNNMKNALSERTFNNMKVDDKIYGVITASVPVGKGPSTTTMLAVRKDYMEKLNVSNPQTLAEFTALLQTIKDQDPGGNGSQNVPLTIAGNVNIVGIQGAFGIANVWNDVDGKLVHRAEDPRYREYLAYLRDLYSKGLLDKEFPTNKSTTIQEKFSSGKAAVVPLAYWEVNTVLDAMNKNVPDAALGWLDPPIGENGERGIGVGGGNGMDRISFIPKVSKHAEDTIKWMDAKLDSEVFRNLVIGEEGTHYTVKDGEYWPITPAFFDDRSYANDFLTGLDERVYGQYWQARVRKDERVYEAFKYMAMDDRQLAFSVLNPVEDVPIMEGQKQEAVLNQLLQDYSMKVICGTESLDNYETFLNQWRAEGGELLSKEMNEWYANKQK